MSAQSTVTRLRKERVHTPLPQTKAKDRGPRELADELRTSIMTLLHLIDAAFHETAGDDPRTSALLLAARSHSELMGLTVDKLSEQVGDTPFYGSIEGWQGFLDEEYAHKTRSAA
ncbi:hypothetical protein [Rubrivivax sp. JA1026]|uniref:hypothetical protein n=1 Tax=Rubrivivax sp. JA1026 TaxID=2710888 RepID=UPI0013E9708A|nr:hypothetical protein [Rubrivivax sp. JA1026]